MSKERFGKSRYGIYQFPKLESIEKWSAELFSLHQSSPTQFTPWEQEFIPNVYSKLAKGIELTEESVWRLEQLYAKYTN